MAVNGVRKMNTLTLHSSITYLNSIKLLLEPKLDIYVNVLSLLWSGGHNKYLPVPYPGYAIKRKANH